MTTDRDIDAVVDLVRSNDKLRQELGELRARLERSRETSAKWCNDAGHENIRAEKAEQQRDRMGEALRDALDIVLWMSGSADFSPDGQAYDGWVKSQVRLAGCRAAFVEVKKT